MGLRIRVFAEQLLFASCIVIAFLLVFEQKLVIPAWLQPVGRMHPLILHFPIVLVLLAMILEFFSFNAQNKVNPFYRQLLRDILLAGGLFTALTVVMGLLLSKETGYSGDTLLWHKYSGAGIFYLVALIYFLKDRYFYKPVLGKAGAVLAVCVLLITGHYGAALTHGDNFVLAPLIAYEEKPAIPIEQAVVFDHVIKPIFDQKCTGCHNQDKLKGELILTDAASIRKGGKSGKLFVPGNPAMSLLLQRIHLSMDDKKHMPPSGKMQLTSEEAQILALWVKSEASFKRKVTELPKGDSLRTLAEAFLKPADVIEEKYEFDAADEEVIAKLNSDYRTVRMDARESPALSVNLYNRKAYSVAKLEDLKEIREQVVSLNLNKLPVKDADLKSVGHLKNLRRLDLNFTDVTAEGLKELTGLKYLHTLTLSGSKVNLSGLRKNLGNFKALRTITLWETGLTPGELAQLKKDYPLMTIIGGFKDDGKNPLRLNPPQVKNVSTVFRESLSLDLRHPIKGVQIRFTTDGSGPDSLKSPLFDGRTVLKENTRIAAVATKAGWYASDTAVFDFFRSTFVPDSTTILFPLNRVHQAEADKTFFNFKLGVIGANNPAWANSWAGVRNNDMGIVSEFRQPVTISSVGLHYMVEEDTGIFPPALVEVWGGMDRNTLKLITKFKAPPASKGETPSLKMASGHFKAQTVMFVKIVAKPVSEMPEWHRNKGKKALLLVDEMFIN
jgi:uncharacterized membrane protein